MVCRDQMGVSTGWGGGARLTGIVGRRTALRLLAWSPNVTAAEALSIGLLDAVASEPGGASVKARDFLADVLETQAFGAPPSVGAIAHGGGLRIPILLTMVDAHSFGRYRIIPIKEAYIFVTELSLTFTIYHRCNN